MATCLANSTWFSGILQCPELTAFDTIATDNTAAIVDGVRLVVDTGCLAILGTEGAVLTLVFVEADLHP